MDRRGFLILARFPKQTLTVVKLLTGSYRPRSSHSVIGRRSGKRSCPSIVAVRAVSPLRFHLSDGRRVRQYRFAFPLCFPKSAPH